MALYSRERTKVSRDTEVDDILANLRKKTKKVNSNRKGKRGEKNVCKKLIERFQKPFSRNPDTFGSGAWSTNKGDLQEELDLDHLAGDIITPKGFSFCIENKKGYDMEVFNLMSGANRKRDKKLLDEFIEQAERDAERVGKIPMVLYAKDRCPVIAFIPEVEIRNRSTFLVMLRYGSYVGISLGDLLELPDDFFFRL